MIKKRAGSVGTRPALAAATRCRVLNRLIIAKTIKLMKFKQQLVASTKLVMKITIVQLFLTIIFMCSLYAKEANSQAILEKKITLNVKNELLNRVIKQIKAQTNVGFSFSESALKSGITITCSVKNKTLSDFFNNDLAAYNIGYRVVNDQIVLFQNSRTRTAGEKEPGTASPVFADIIITGYVYDDTNLPLPGATVREKGTTNATATDSKGFFSIKVKNQDAILVISSIGLTAKEVSVGTQKSIKITLGASSTNLQDVVVVGYSTQKKINVTGAISSIGTKELIQSPAANISNSLVGRLPGLFASQANGEPGNDASTLRIRGSGTYSGNTNPLILVDGIEVTNYNNIDPNEIESLTILKDASSTAVYGIRGANGVLIITTKRGKIGPPRVSYTFNQAINSFTALVNDLNSADFARSSNEGQLLDSYITGAPYTPRYSDADIALYESGADPIFHPNINWPKLMFRKFSSQLQHNVTVSGGQKGVQYFISGGLFSQEGLFRDTKDIIKEFSANSVYKRYNFRSNFNFDATKRLKIRFDVSSQFENKSGNNIGDPALGANTGRLVSDILKASPLDGPGYLDGKIVNITNATVNNPFISLLASPGGGGLRKEYDNYLIGSLRLDHDLDFITPGFKVHGNIAYNTFNNQTIVNQKTLPIYIVSRLPDGTLNFQPNSFTATPEFKFDQPVGVGNNSTRRVTTEFGFDYNRTFEQVHTLTALLLYNQQKTYDPLFVPAIPKGYQSLVGRIAYSYKSRYLAEFDAGYNGSENFAPGRRFGFFPAYSAGWVASEEKFFPKNEIISYLKFRGSYGEVGNDVIGGNRFLYNATSYNVRGISTPTYFFGNYASNYTAYSGIVEGAAGNANVTWERARKTDIGIEMYLLKEKIKIIADYFNEDRRNILTSPNTISQVAGLIQPAVNLGSMRNRGFDGEISYIDKAGAFNYRISANYSYAHNTVLFRDEVPNTYSYQNRTGQRLGQYYAIPTNGIFNTWAEVNDLNRPVYQGTNKVQPGDLRYIDVNGDGKIDPFDALPVGYSNVPEKTYGISLSGSYKGFDFSVLFQGASNVSLAYISRQRTTDFSSTPPTAAADYMIQSWTPERYAQGLPINFPRLSYTASNNPNGFGADIYIADASYLRLKNVELGYTINGNLLKKVGVSSARVFANSNNLYTWSKVYKGVDPENAPQNGTSDVAQQSYPLVRTINFGINVNF